MVYSPRLVLSALLVAGCAAAPESAAEPSTDAGIMGPSQEYVNEDFGFRITLPDGWHAAERDSSTETNLELVLAPLSAPDRVQLTVRVNPPGVSPDPEAARRLSIRSADPSTGASDLEEDTRHIAGRDAPALRVNSTSNGQTYAVRQAFLAEHGMLFLLQDVTFVDEFEERVADFDAVWAGLEFTAPSEERAARARLDALAARCGSEIDWAADWEDAARRAREERRPILVTARMYPGFDISDDRMSETFMDRDIIALVEERYVALDVGLGVEAPFVDPDVYGMSRYTFGTAALIVTPDGEVLMDAVGAADELLIAGLSLDPALPGPPPPSVTASRRERAQAHYRRGELDRVAELLAVPRHASEHRMLANLHRRQRRGEEALRSLAAARRAPGADALAVDLDLDEAMVLTRLDRVDDAVALLDGVIERAPDHARYAEALYRRASLARHLEGGTAAEPRYRRIIDEHSDTRWAWLSAATLTSTAWAVDETGSVAWPDEDLYALLAPPVYEPLPVDEARRAARDALAYLLESQRDDGTWPMPADFGAKPDDPPSDFQLAINAICIQSLLPHKDDPRVAAAIDGAVEWLLPAYEEARTGRDRAYFMDYTVWSRPYLIGALADLVEHGLVDRQDVRPVVDQLYDELAERQKPGGGWSYYLTGDIESAPRELLLSMSFTTATNVLALLRAKEMGLEPPEELIERGLDSIESARTDDGYFTYMVGPDATRSVGAAGAAGRGPLCALALLRGERSDHDDVRERLEAFLEHRASYVSETGKTLMHTGLQAQGSHWLVYDYANAAAATAELAPDERSRYSGPILESLLAARTNTGAYLDNPILGSVLGAGMALAAYHHLLTAD